MDPFSAFFKHRRFLSGAGKGKWSQYNQLWIGLRRLLPLTVINFIKVSSVPRVVGLGLSVFFDI